MLNDKDAGYRLPGFMTLESEANAAWVGYAAGSQTVLVDVRDIRGITAGVDCHRYPILHTKTMGDLKIRTHTSELLIHIKRAQAELATPAP